MAEILQPKILFSGTPEIAAFVLEKLLREGARVVGVLTAPDKPAGRGLHLQSSPVKLLAQEYQLPFFQPEKLRNPDFLAQIASLNPDLGVVVAFRMLPEEVWNMPRLGTINLHASLLPAYRGAAPINRAVMAGESISGITTFQLKKEIDTGDLLLQEEMAIGENETAGELYGRMMHRGADLVWETVKGLVAGTLQGKPQNHELASPAPKIFREDTRINPEKSAFRIHNQIRGLQPHPGAFLEWEGKILKIHQSLKTEKPCGDLNAGKLVSSGNRLFLSCGDDYLEILNIQPEGKRIMSAREFLAGHKTMQITWQ